MIMLDKNNPLAYIVATIKKNTASWILFYLLYLPKTQNGQCIKFWSF